MKNCKPFEKKIEPEDALVAELLPLKEQLVQAHARIKELEDRLAQDSRTSSKPPSSDGLARLPRRSRRPSGKRPGGQAGHTGHTLALVEQPDDVVCHRPQVCSQCGEDLSAVRGRVVERRQVLDDYHVISEPQVHGSLTSLLEHLPPQLHMILATRADPPLSLSRLRAHDQVLEVRTEQLPRMQQCSIEYTLRRCRSLPCLCKQTGSIDPSEMVYWNAAQRERSRPTIL
jgi:Family of unknown function (DUF6444)